MILVIDNYDSFTYNLVQAIREISRSPVNVLRNDKITLRQIKDLSPKMIIISPGPGRPEQAGISNDVVKTYAGKIPILGVCLGHQCIAQTFDAHIVKADNQMHGKTSLIHHDEKTIFRSVENPFSATRYHSLIVDRRSISDDFEVSAETDEGEVMGIRIKGTLSEGIQFHPESILTTEGKKIITNFVNSVET